MPATLIVRSLPLKAMPRGAEVTPRHGAAPGEPVNDNAGPAATPDANCTPRGENVAIAYDKWTTTTAT